MRKILTFVLALILLTLPLASVFSQCTVTVTSSGASGPFTICSGSSITLNANASPGCTGPSFEWTSIPAGVYPQNQTIIVSPVVPTNYKVVVIIGTTRTDSSTVQVNLNPVPVGSATAQTICSGSASNVALTSTVTGSSFTWTAAQQSGSTITGFSNCSTSCGTSIQQTLTNTSNSAAGVVRYTVTPTANGCAGATFTVDVTVNPAPTGSSSGTTTMCSGSTTSLNLTSTISGSSFTWTAGQQSGSTITGFSNCSTSCGTSIQQTLTNTNNSTAGVVRYIVTPTASGANGCTGPTFNIDMTVNPAPLQPSISSQQTAEISNICSGTRKQNINLSIDPNITQYTYSCPDLIFPTTVVNSPNMVFNVPITTVPFTTSLTITQTNQFNCSSTTTIPVNVSTNPAPDTADIILKDTGQLLIYLDNTLDSYRWGFDDKTTLSPSFFDNQIYQIFMPDDTLLIGGLLDTTKFYYWVLVEKNGCHSKIYYNGPYKNPKRIKEEITSGEVTSTIIPNPNNGNFEFNLSGKIYGTVDLRIFNSIGQLVSLTQYEKTLSSQNFTLRLPRLNQGMYFIKVSDVYGERLVSKLLIR